MFGQAIRVGGVAPIWSGKLIWNPNKRAIVDERCGILLSFSFFHSSQSISRIAGFPE